MREIKHIAFEIVLQKKLKIEIPLNVTRRYPVKAHDLIQAEKIMVIYKYIPYPSLDEEKYLNWLCEWLKEEYNAYSVTYGVMQQQLKP